MRTNCKRRTRSAPPKLSPMARWKNLASSARKELRADPVFRSAEAIKDRGWRRRGELEAGILARQSTEDIAQVMNLPAAVVEGYTHWFFDIREDLDQKDAVMRDVVGYTFSKPLGRDEVPTLWKWLGYLGGLRDLESLLTAIDDQALRKRDVDIYLQPQSSLDINFKLFIAIFRMPSGRTPSECGERRQLFELLKAQASPEYHKDIRMFLTPIGCLPEMLDSETEGAGPETDEEADDGELIE